MVFDQHSVEVKAQRGTLAQLLEREGEAAGHTVQEFACHPRSSAGTEGGQEENEKDMSGVL